MFYDSDVTVLPKSDTLLTKIRADAILTCMRFCDFFLIYF